MCCCSFFLLLILLFVRLACTAVTSTRTPHRRPSKPTSQRKYAGSRSRSDLVLLLHATFELAPAAREHTYSRNDYVIMLRRWRRRNVGNVLKLYACALSRNRFKCSFAKNRLLPVGGFASVCCVARFRLCEEKPSVSKCTVYPR